MYVIRAEYEFGVDFGARKPGFASHGATVYGCDLERDPTAEAADWEGRIECELQWRESLGFVRRGRGRTLAVRAGSREANPDMMRSRKRIYFMAGISMCMLSM